MVFRCICFCLAIGLLLAWCLFGGPPANAHHHRPNVQGAVFFQGGYTPRVNAFSLNVYSPSNAALAAALNAQAAYQARAAAAAAYRSQAQAALYGSAVYGSFQPRYVPVPQQPFAAFNVPGYQGCNVPPPAAPFYPSCPPGASSLFYR